MATATPTLKPVKSETLSTADCWNLLWGAGGKKLKLRLIDVVLFEDDGRPTAWLFTSKEGEVKKKSSSSLTLTNVYKRFVFLASGDTKSSKSHAAVAYLADGSQVPLSTQVLAEVLLSGPKLGRLKTGGRVKALRAYIHQRGGHGSGFRNTFKVRDRDHKKKPITSTQRLLALDEQVSSNKKIVYCDLKSTATKLNASLDEVTARLVAFLEKEQNKRCWYVEADFVVDQKDQIWVAHFEQIVFSKLQLQNESVLWKEELGLGRGPGKKKPVQRGQDISPISSPPDLDDARVQPRGAGPRLPTPGAFVCPGDFCGYDGEAGAKKSDHNIPWTTDKAIERERQALQETISAYRRTMSETSALGNAIAMAEKDDIAIVAQHFTMMNKSILHAHEPDAESYMSHGMLKWREQQSLNALKEFNLEVVSPSPGKSMSASDPIAIKWKNRGKIAYVRIQLYCGWAASTVVTDGLPNEGFATWRPDVDFRRREADNMKALGNACVWRFKVSCASRPCISAFSKRFSLRRSHSQSRIPETALSFVKKNVHELQAQMEEEERFQADAAMKHVSSAAISKTENTEVPTNNVMAGVLANAHPVDHYYREVEVCKNCYNCYTAMDRRREKDTRRQSKTKGGVGTVWAKRLDRQRKRLENEEDDANDLRGHDTFSSTTRFTTTRVPQGHSTNEYVSRLSRPKHDMTKPRKKVGTFGKQVRIKSGDSPSRRPPPTIGDSTGRHGQSMTSFGKEYKTFRSANQPGRNKNNRFGRPNKDENRRIHSPVQTGGFGEDDDYANLDSNPEDYDDSDEEPLLLGSTRVRSPQRDQVTLKSHSARLSSTKKGKMPPTSKNKLPQHNTAPHRVVGNYVNRVTAFVWEHFEGKIPNRGPLTEIDQNFVGDVNKGLQCYLEYLKNGSSVEEGTETVVNMCRRGTKYLMDTSYWQLVDDNRARCATVLTLAMDLVLLLALTMEPYVPLLADKIQKVLNVRATAKWIPKIFAPGIVPSGHELSPPEPLYEDVEDETAEDSRIRIKKRLQQSERRRKKREKESVNSKMAITAKERGWGMGNALKKNEEGKRSKEKSITNSNAQSPVYRTAFPGWGLNPTPTPRSKKREEMKAARQQELEERAMEKKTKSQVKQKTTTSKTSAVYLLDDKYGHAFVDPPDMPTPNVNEYSSAANASINVAKHQGGENFDFSRSSLRQALWMGRSAIAKQSSRGNDIEFDSESYDDSFEASALLSKKKISRSLPALDKPTPNVMPYLNKASLSATRKKQRNTKGGDKSPVQRKRRGKSKNEEFLTIGPMPRELHARSGLRQVVSLLVMGQLKDIRLVLDIAKKSGLRVLAHCRADGDQLVLGVTPLTAGNKTLPETPPLSAKLLREFLNVGAAFEKLWDLKSDGTSYLVNGARELSHGLRDGSPSQKHLQLVNRAIGATEKFYAWLGVGASRAEILKGVSAWQSGQAGVAHHHWMKAVESAVEKDGELAYDAAVARFLIGKHNQSASAYVAEHALEYLSQADMHFARLGEGSDVELEAVRAEIERLRGGRPKAVHSTGAEKAKEITGHLSKKEMIGNNDDPDAEEQAHFITRPPTAIRETLNWGRKTLDVIKRRLHSDKMLPLYHPPDENMAGSRRAEQMDSRRQGLAKAVVVAEGQLAALEAEVKAALSTGSVEARPNTAMQFGMERKLIKLIDEVSARASELSKIDERESKYDNRMQQNSSFSGYSEAVMAKGGGGIRFVPPEERGISPAKKVEIASGGNDKAGIEAGSKAIDSQALEKSMGLKNDDLPNYYKTPWRPTNTEDPVDSAVAKAANHSHKISPKHSSESGADLLVVLKSQLVESADKDELGKLVQVMATQILKIDAVVDDDGNTVLIRAAKCGSKNVVDYCVNHMKNYAADPINAQNFEGNTALHYAYERKDLAMVDLLVSSGANAHLQNMYGLKAMAGARPRSFLDFAAYAV
jgi:hypothetical protein